MSCYLLCQLGTARPSWLQTLAHHPLLTYTCTYCCTHRRSYCTGTRTTAACMVLHTSSSLISCCLFSSAGDVPTVPVHIISKLVSLSFHISSTAQTRGPTDAWNHGRPSHHSNTNPPTLNLPTRHPQQSVPCIPAQLKQD